MQTNNCMDYKENLSIILEIRIDSEKNPLYN